ncbi:hypothetical protein BCU83_07070 [Vibrio breoganii]|uniref:polysaccharide pyruvyl transferase family protein n=1 Tax=Vibrio breoganii TaxID=553239 RepID=UPI000C829C07|nr:polysaccharide pyruvyl transferase family protein [Vibrio breoganii]PMG82572.1 hypothetical protein BCU83_07070 [Vibrio breoganii]PMO27572.1 hypothetical protein BCT12_18850 [Vibrio breoganii]
MKKAVILNDTSFESHHGCEVVVKNIKELLLKNGIETIDTHPVGKPWLENEKFIFSMRKADIVIVNGEGTLHHSQDRARDLISVGKYVKENINIPVVLINSTYQENNNEIIDYTRYYDLIFVRESLSKEELVKYNIESEVVPDISFYSEYDLSQKLVTKDIGVTDSVYLDLSERLYNFALSKDYSFLPAKTDRKIRYFNIYSFFSYARYHLLKAVRYPLYKLGILKLKFSKLRKFYYIEGYDNYVNRIAASSFMVIARYHSLCFSLKTLTPFYTLKSNSHKIEGILRDVGIGQSRVITEQEMLVLRHKALTEEEKTRIKAYVSEAPKKIEKMFMDISNLVN